MDFNNVHALHQETRSAHSFEFQEMTLKTNLFAFDLPIQQHDSQKLLRVNVKCMINQEFLIIKERILQPTTTSKTNQFTILIETQLIDIKIEYSFHIDQKYLKTIKYLKENYNEDDNVVQIILLSSQGVKSPTAYDFKLLLECYDNLEKQNNDLKNFINIQTQGTLSRLLICACVFEVYIQHNMSKEKELIEQFINRLSKNLSLESLIKILLICIQYEENVQGQKYYLQMFNFYMKGFQFREITKPQLQEIISNLSSSQIKLLTDDIFVLNTPVYSYKIDGIFFKPMMKLQDLRKKKFFLPLQKYQFFKTFRKKLNEQNKENTYPHTFELRDEVEGKVHLVAYQESAHDEILIFETEVSHHKIKIVNFLRCIERNYWGTHFRLYDYGYPQEIETIYPNYFGHVRKLLVEISYETNIMATQPRKFVANMLNYVNNENMELKQLEPVYNTEKDCYQLNFYGRAKKASARNFEMIDPFDSNIIYLLHGKWQKDLFNLDYRYPMTMIQAFSFSLVSISKKFLVA